MITPWTNTVVTQAKVLQAGEGANVGGEMAQMLIVHLREAQRPLAIATSIYIQLVSWPSFSNTTVNGLQ